MPRLQSRAGAREHARAAEQGWGSARLHRMDLDVAIRQRRMVRSFADRPLPGGLVTQMVDLALRAPTAGNTRGTAWVVLEGSDQTERYWMAATDPEWRSRSRRWPGLSPAPAVAVSLCSPSAYADRYEEADKQRGERAGAGDAGAHRWPVPYWVADAAFGVMTLLLQVTANGLGACFLGNFRNEQGVLDALGVPPGWRLFGAVALGFPDGADHLSPSLDRPGPGRAARLHRGQWGHQ